MTTTNEHTERARFESWADETQPKYWRTTAWARDAWQIWKAAALLEAQPAREWVGLTDDERNEIYRKSFKLIDSRLVGEQVDFVRAIESKLREKNAGLPVSSPKPQSDAQGGKE